MSGVYRTIPEVFFRVFPLQERLYMPGTSVSSVRLPYSYLELLRVCKTVCATVPVLWVNLYLCHNTLGTGTDSGFLPYECRVCYAF